MRLSIELDGQLLVALTAAAEQRLSSLEATAAAILKGALQPPEFEVRNGVPLLPRASPGRPVTLETIRLVEDELLCDEARPEEGRGPGAAEPRPSGSR